MGLVVETYRQVLVLHVTELPLLLSRNKVFQFLDFPQQNFERIVSRKLGLCRTLMVYRKLNYGAVSEAIANLIGCINFQGNEVDSDLTRQFGTVTFGALQRAELITFARLK